MMSKCPVCLMRHADGGGAFTAVCTKPSCQRVDDMKLDTTKSPDLKLVELEPDPDDLLFPATEPDRLLEAFLRHHAKNPHIYVLLRDKALVRLGEGEKFYSIKGLFEEVRYDHKVRTTGQKEKPKLKLSNNHTAFYSRMIMERVPELAGFFKTKNRRSTS